MKKLNFGSGYTRKEGYVNADLSDVDVNFDFNEFPYPFKDNYFDEIYTENALDHLTDYCAVMKELHRICKPEGIIHIIVPFYNSQTSYMSTHKQHFTFQHFACFLKCWKHKWTPEFKGKTGFFLK